MKKNEGGRAAILQQLHNDLCGDLDRIKERFIGSPRVSLVVRFDDPEKGVWLTDDTAADAIEYIIYMETQNDPAQGARLRDAAGKSS